MRRSIVGRWKWLALAGAAGAAVLVASTRVATPTAGLVNTAANTIADKFYVGRAPHEGFISPDGRELWVAIRGQNWVSVIDLRRAAREDKDDDGGTDRGQVGDERFRIHT